MTRPIRALNVGLVVTGFGSSGNDTLRGGAKPDRLNGGAGTDICRGGGGRDVIRRCEG